MASDTCRHGVDLAALALCVIYAILQAAPDTEAATGDRSEPVTGFQGCVILEIR